MTTMTTRTMHLKAMGQGRMAATRGQGTRGDNRQVVTSHTNPNMMRTGNTRPASNITNDPVPTTHAPPLRATRYPHTSTTIPVRVGVSMLVNSRNRQAPQAPAVNSTASQRYMRTAATMSHQVRGSFASQLVWLNHQFPMTVKVAEIWNTKELRRMPRLTQRQLSTRTRGRWITMMGTDAGRCTLGVVSCSCA